MTSEQDFNTVLLEGFTWQNYVLPNWAHNRGFQDISDHLSKPTIGRTALETDEL